MPFDCSSSCSLLFFYFCDSFVPDKIDEYTVYSSILSGTKLTQTSAATMYFHIKVLMIYSMDVARVIWLRSSKMFFEPLQKLARPVTCLSPMLFITCTFFLDCGSLCCLCLMYRRCIHTVHVQIILNFQTRN